VRSGHKGVYWFGQERPYVQWILLLLVLPLHRSARSRGYKLLREGANPRSHLRGGVCGCFWRGVCVVVPLVLIFLDVAPASPFIVSNERTRVTFMVKR
jgi:hypothetical protein